MINPKHLLHHLMVRPITAHKWRLQSRHAFVPAARKLLNELSKLSILAAQWIDYKRDVKYSEDPSELRLFVPKPIARPLGMGVLRPAWVRLNHLRCWKIPVIHALIGTCSYINL